VNPILAQAEVGVETDTSKFKMGTGSTHWNDLDYANAAAGIALIIALGS
jgi:hypothetical protein